MIDNDDLSSAIKELNRFKASKIFLSAHDTCDNSLERMAHELEADTEVLKAGKTYRFEA